jgi:hypothetical protein
MPVLASAALIAAISIGCAQGYPISYAPGASGAPGAPGVSEGAEGPIAECPFEPGEVPELGARRGRAESFLAAADQPAPTTGMVLDGGKLGHDPQIAVGDRFVILYTAHHYRILDKATGQIAAVERGDEIPSESDFAHLFSPLWSPLDKRGGRNRTNLNSRLRFTADDEIPCDENAPFSSKSCVQEFYDTRIQWDPVRRRFWVESAARNHLWACGPAGPNTGGAHEDDDEGETPGVATIGSVGAKPLNEIGGDPDCADGKHSVTQARRFIVVAVSVSDDPRKGWHRYALTDEYSDWPKMAVNERYLLLGYRSSPNVFVFDADRLAAGNPDHGPVRVATVNARALGGPIKVLTLVTHHGPTGGFTFLVGSDGGEVVTPVALYNPDPSRAAPPVLVRGPGVDVGSRFGSFEDNPIYRDGQLYLATDECANGAAKCPPWRSARVTRLPVRAEGGRAPRVWSAADPSAGFLSVLLSGHEPYEPATDLVSYEKPAVDVNARGDMVIVFARRGHRTMVPLPSEVRYTIVYHGEQRPRPSVLLKRGTDTDIPDVDDNRKAGIDLAFAQTDPVDDTTVWITHAYADAGVHWFRQIAAAVRP